MDNAKPQTAPISKAATHVSGTIKPLEWSNDGDLHRGLLEGSGFGRYCVWVWQDAISSEWVFGGNKSRHPTLEAAQAAAQASYEARILAQIQPDAEAQPVASSEAGELLPCPFCSSSQIEDVMRTGAVVCQDCRASATNNRQWNRRALPAARAEKAEAENERLRAALSASVEFADWVADQTGIDMDETILTVRVMPVGREVGSKSWAEVQNDARAALDRKEGA